MESDAVTTSNKAKEELYFWPNLVFVSIKGQKYKPLPLATLRLVDESDEDVPLGQPGEIVVQGPLVFQQRSQQLREAPGWR